MRSTILGHTHRTKFPRARLRIRLSCRLEAAMGLHQIADQHFVDEIGSGEDVGYVDVRLRPLVQLRVFVGDGVAVEAEGKPMAVIRAAGDAHVGVVRVKPGR